MKYVWEGDITAAAIRKGESHSKESPEEHTPQGLRGTAPEIEIWKDRNQHLFCECSKYSQEPLVHLQTCSLPLHFTAGFPIRAFLRDEHHQSPVFTSTRWHQFYFPCAVFPFLGLRTFFKNPTGPTFRHWLSLACYWYIAQWDHGFWWGHQLCSHGWLVPH